MTGPRLPHGGQRVGPTGPHKQDPLDLTLAQWRDVAPEVTEVLVRQFGEAGAVRVLNGQAPTSAPTPTPADPATIPAPGAKAVSHLHGGNRRTARARSPEPSY